MYDKKDPAEQIAVIGMSAQFPKSETLAEFWRHIDAGTELICRVEQNSEETPSNYVPFKGSIENPLTFDADLFGLSPREAEYSDPQQRKLLEHAWAALEHAGYNPDIYEGLIGVFASTSISSYFYHNVVPSLKIASLSHSDEMLAVLGNDKDFTATKISYMLNLKGPSKTIQTACSSSLVSMHDACQSLLNFEMDIALVAASSITFPLDKGYFHLEEGITSKDGKCRPFDQNSSGTVSGNGAGVIVLKRYDEALEDRDSIYGVIRGSAINNDGANKVGYTAPSVRGQVDVIRSAIESAEVSPSDITYLETHGTGTQLGDAIEIEALKTVFDGVTENSCAIGSVKANIGHLDAAAGLAGFTKVLLSLNEKTIPKLLHFSQPNNNLNLGTSPFYFPKENIQWQSETPRIAGVSSFGIGGTNAHLIVEEAPQFVENPSNQRAHLTPFSAKNETVLRSLIEKFHIFLLEHQVSLADLAFTLQVGRRFLPTKTFFVVSSQDQLISSLEAFLNGEPNHLHQSLPQFEIGQQWTQSRVDQFPDMYPDEKRRRIPLPCYPFSHSTFYIEPLNQTQLQVKESTVPSNEPLDVQVANFWKNALKITEVKGSTDFFVEGGDSLLALDLIDQVKNLCFVDLKLADLFDHPTYEEFTQFLYELLLKESEQLAPEQAQKVLQLL